MVDCAVFGVADEQWGQRVCAAVVPVVSPNGPARDRLLEGLATLAASRLAGYKRPKQYVVVDELPRTATGKVQRNRIPDLVHPG